MGTLAIGGGAYALMPRETCEPKGDGYGGAVIAADRRWMRAARLFVQAAARAATADHGRAAVSSAETHGQANAREPGRAFPVAVDLRIGSPTLGKWFGVTQSERDRKLVWAPASFARGFAVLSDFAEIEYLATGTYNSAAESGIAWNDALIGIEWPVSEPILSAKDAKAQSLTDWLARPEATNFQYQ